MTAVERVSARGHAIGASNLEFAWEFNVGHYVQVSKLAPPSRCYNAPVTVGCLSGPVLRRMGGAIVRTLAGKLEKRASSDMPSDMPASPLDPCAA